MEANFHKEDLHLTYIIIILIILIDNQIVILLMKDFKLPMKRDINTIYYREHNLIDKEIVI